MTAVPVLVALAAGGLAVRDLRSASCAPAVELRVAASAEKRAVAADLAGAFEAASAVDGCRTARLTAYTAASAGWMRAALAGGWRDALSRIGPQPDVWLPDSSVEVERAGRGLPAGDQGVRLDARGSIASSPLVLGVPDPVARRLGWPGAAGLGWDALLAQVRRHRLALQRSGPASSASGLLATASLYLAQPDGRLEPRRLGDGRRLLDLEQTIAGSDDQPTDLLCTLRQRPGAAATAAPLLSEKLLSDYDRGAPLAGECDQQADPPPTRLDAFYPAGSLALDHPCVLVEAPWTGPRTAPWRWRVARAFCDYLLRDGRAQQTLRRAGFRGPGGTVDGDAPSPLTTANGAVAGRVAGAASPGPAVLEQVSQRWRAARRPARVLLALDVSGSMRAPFAGGGTRIAAAAAAAREALGMVAGGDQLGLWEFAALLDGRRDYRELVPLGPAGRQGGRIAARLAAARVRPERPGPDGGTGLYGTVQAALAALRRGYQPRAVNAVVLLSGGADDRPGGVDLFGLLDAVQRGQRVPVFLLVFGGASCRAPSPLAELAAQSGGGCYRAGGPEPWRALARLGASLWGADRERGG